MATAATAAITNWISALHLPLAKHECRHQLKLVLGADDSRCEEFPHHPAASAGCHSP